MKAIRKIAIWTAMATLLLCAMAGFAVVVTGLAAGGSTGGTLASGRSVIADSDALALSSVFSADSAMIKTAGHTIDVRPDRLVIDGRVVASIDRKVAEVKVHVIGGTVGFEADGQVVQLSSK